ncbi:MAG: serine/threonine protein phosphatase [Clostridia bacterium]|nr:serine/threonine protein phosphatase [Clostridia bacterium]
MYFITENLIPLEKCHVIHSKLDDLIPFNEYFLIFYCGWYALIVVSLLYFALYDTGSFRKLSLFILGTQIIAMIVYIVYPNRQDLRPEVFERDNFLTRLMAFIYAFDTPSGVCPSLHVGYSIGIASTWLKAKDVSPWVKAFITVFVVMICISVAFVKQHSVVDIFAALPMCALVEAVVFRDWWRERLHKKA